MDWVGRLSIVGAAGNPPPALVPEILRKSRPERTLAVVCRNLGLPCPEERAVLARQLLARSQWDEIRERIDAIPLKGLDLAHRLYPSPGLRDMGDLDLLVRRPSVSSADAALQGLGYRPEHPVDRLMASSDLLNAAEYFREGSLPVHLHWHVSNASLPHFMYRVDMEEIWAGARHGLLAPHHQVVTLCEHALKHSFSELIHLTDLELASRGVDAGLVAETARRWGLEGAVHYARVLARDLMGIEIPALGAVRPPALGWEGRAFLAWARRRRWNGLSALGFLSMTRGIRQKARFVRETLAPEGVEGLTTPTVGGRIRRALEMMLTSP
jgi:putative nucleotidyltransferase-like protein